MTDAEERASPGADSDAQPLPADPRQYDSSRNVLARRKGLDAPYIAGGQDPELRTTLRRERRDVRLLVAMAVGIVLLGFVLGIVGVLLGAGRPA